MSSANKDEPELDTLSSRRCPPAHYVAKINPVKELLNLSALKFGPFEVGGYNWRLLLKPQKVYMSLYLEIDEPCKIGHNEEVLVDYKFFVFNYKNCKYDIFKERGKELRAFTKEKTRWGFSEFLSLKGFQDPQRGYLDDNCCKIGAELLVSKPIRTKAALTITNPSRIKDNPKVQTKIQGFSASESRPKYSKDFTLEGRDWKLKVRPEHEMGTEWLSVHLEAQFISPGKLLLVNAMLRLLNTDPKKFIEKEVKGWLRANNCTCGELKFMPWSDLKKGFIQGNELTFEVRILTVVNVTRNDELAKSLP